MPECVEQLFGPMSALQGNRWAILAVLFAARATMAFQYQAVASVSPLYETRFGVSLAEIGVLIGIYFAPGVIIALPGGAIGRRFGDRKVIALGMILMILGAAAGLASQSWAVQLGGRLVSGVGGILLNVLMTKLVTDHFSGRDISTAMAIFVNSWPFGIATALLILPLMGSVAATQVAVITCVTLGLIVFLAVVKPPSGAHADTTPNVSFPRHALTALAVAGAIWSLYNAALSMVFAFGPAYLVEAGWDLPSAGAATSIVLWLVAISVPAGGILADRSHRRDLVMAAGFLAFAATLLVVTWTSNLWLTFIFLGFVSGISAGPIMSLPAQVLSPGNRAIGMGMFYAIYYLGTGIAPFIAGALSEWQGSAAVAFQFGALLLVVCCACLVFFNRVARRIEN